MSAAQIVLTLVLAAAAFAAGWAARGSVSRREPVPAPLPVRRSEPAPDPEPADDGRASRAALAEAAEALPAIIDQWLDDRGGPSPEAWPKLGRFDRAVAVLDEAGDDLPPETAGALREARDCLQRYREGLALDADTSRRLGAVEEALERG